MKKNKGKIVEPKETKSMCLQQVKIFLFPNKSVSTFQKKLFLQVSLDFIGNRSEVNWTKTTEFLRNERITQNE